jgi:hypothetical protein
VISPEFQGLGDICCNRKLKLQSSRLQYRFEVFWVVMQVSQPKDPDLNRNDVLTVTIPYFEDISTPADNFSYRTCQNMP